MNPNNARLRNEILQIQKLDHENSQFLVNYDESNIYNWHFLLKNLDGAYKGGIYHGEFIFPAEYPFKPPQLFFHTPNGKFMIGRKICLSFTSYHPDTWSPNWRVENMLNGIISFMYTTDITAGGITTDEEKKKSLAKASWDFNKSSNENFLKHFSHYNLKKPDTFPIDTEKIDLKVIVKEEKKGITHKIVKFFEKRKRIVQKQKKKNSANFDQIFK